MGITGATRHANSKLGKLEQLLNQKECPINDIQENIKAISQEYKLNNREMRNIKNMVRRSLVWEALKEVVGKVKFEMIGEYLRYPKPVQH